MEFDRALTEAKPGDVILVSSGVYTGGKKIVGVAGTSRAPIVIQSEQLYGAKIEGGGFGFFAGRSSNFKLVGFDIVGSKIWGIFMGGGPGSPGKVPYGAVTNVVIANNRVREPGQEGISVRGYKDLETHHVLIACNEVFNTGRNNGRFGEAIYVGSGQPGPSEVTHDVIIEDNHLHDTTSEAIDIKAPSYNVVIRRNWIHDIRTGTSGAVVLGLRPYTYRDGNYLVEGNRIENISGTSRFQDGNAIVVAHGNTTIRNNVIANTQHRGILIQHSTDLGFGNPNANIVRLINNQATNCGLYCYGLFGRNGIAAKVMLRGNRTDSSSGDDIVNVFQLPEPGRRR